MSSFEYPKLSSRVRFAGALCAAAACLAVVLAMLSLFASASGELDPVLARLRPAPAASEVAVETPAKPAPS